MKQRAARIPVQAPCWASQSMISSASSTRPHAHQARFDGIENKIIRGAAKTLRDPRLKSILVELAPEDRTSDQDVKELITAAGLHWVAAQDAHVPTQSGR
jgi:hypothetical protein